MDDPVRGPLRWVWINSHISDLEGWHLSWGDGVTICESEVRMSPIEGTRSAEMTLRDGPPRQSICLVCQKHIIKRLGLERVT